MTEFKKAKAKPSIKNLQKNISESLGFPKKKKKKTKVFGFEKFVNI